MNSNLLKLTGIVCIIGGVALFLWGQDIARSLPSVLQETVTGSPNKRSVYYTAGGVALALIGIVQIFWPKK